MQMRRSSNEDTSVISRKKLIYLKNKTLSKKIILIKFNYYLFLNYNFYLSLFEKNGLVYPKKSKSTTAYLKIYASCKQCKINKHKNSYIICITDFDKDESYTTVEVKHDDHCHQLHRTDTMHHTDSPTVSEPISSSSPCSSRSVSPSSSSRSSSSTSISRAISPYIIRGSALRAEIASIIRGQYNGSVTKYIYACVARGEPVANRDVYKKILSESTHKEDVNNSC